MESNALTEFLGVLLQTWILRNIFIFSSPNHSLSRLANRAIEYIRGYRVAKLETAHHTHAQQVKWNPPDQGYFKLNFDAGRVGNGAGG